MIIFYLNRFKYFHALILLFIAFSQIHEKVATVILTLLSNICYICCIVRIP
nr:MAG TPA: hypothetical protein [Caudoviricetes sp.]